MCHNTITSDTTLATDVTTGGAGQRPSSAPVRTAAATTVTKNSAPSAVSPLSMRWMTDNWWMTACMDSGMDEGWLAYGGASG